MHIHTSIKVVIGGVIVSVLVTGPMARWFKPGREGWILKGDKNPHYTPSFGREIKPSSPCKIVQYVKDPCGV
jgi:hypothetical protein